MLNVKNSSNIYENVYDWFCKNNVELDAKLKDKFMKTLRRHEHAGIIRFYVRYVNKTKLVHFVYTPDIMSCAFLHTRYRKILISFGQKNYIGKLICVCNNVQYASCLLYKIQKITLWNIIFKFTVLKMLLSMHIYFDQNYLQLTSYMVNPNPVNIRYCQI